MRILHISDTHFFSSKEDESRIFQFSRSVNKAIETYKVDICLHTGDILDRNASGAGYDFYKEYCPNCLHVPGNHDDSSIMKYYLSECADGFPWVKRRGGLSFIGLDSSTGFLPDAQMQKLKTLLEEHECCVILLHHPVEPLGRSWLDKYVLEDYKHFQEVLHTYKTKIIGLFHGHFHHGYMKRTGSYTIIAGASAAYQYHPWTNTPAERTYKSEFSVYDIEIEQARITLVKSIPHPYRLS